MTRHINSYRPPLRGRISRAVARRLRTREGPIAVTERTVGATQEQALYERFAPRSKELGNTTKDDGYP
jgi:hypothetical protein